MLIPALADPVNVLAIPIPPTTLAEKTIKTLVPSAIGTFNPPTDPVSTVPGRVANVTVGAKSTVAAVAVKILLPDGAV